MKRLLKVHSITAPALTATLFYLIAFPCGISCAQAPLGPAKTDSPITLKDASGFLLLDLTKQADKTSPVLRLGYQSNLGDTLNQALKKHVDKNIRGLWNYSINLVGVPANDIANLFTGDTASTGTEMNISFGQSYLSSYVRSLNNQVLIGITGNLENIATAVAALKNDSKINPNELSAKLKPFRDDATTLQDRLKTRKANTTDISLKNALQAGIDYADAIIKYAVPEGLLPESTNKPLPPRAEDIQNKGRAPLYDAWFLRFGYKASSAKFFDSSQPFAQQFSTKHFDGYSVQLGYNVNWGGNFPIIAGMSGGFGRFDNIDQLSSVEVAQTQTFQDGNTVRTLNSKRTALVGTFKQSLAATGKFDLVLYPDLAAASRDPKKPRSTIAIDFFGRARGGSPFMYGIGAYLTQPGSPTKVYGGLNVYHAENNKIAIDIVAGFPF